MDTHFESLYPANTREKEINQILAFIKGGNSCQIISLPGVGRSNLLGMLAYNHDVRVKHLGENQTSYHFVMINFSEIRNRPLLDGTKFIFLSLVDSLRERKFEEQYHTINDIFRESLNFNDELVLFQGLKRAIDLLALDKKLNIIFLFDRFETYIPMLTPQFFTNLRSLRSRAKYHFSVVFSLERPLEDTIEGPLFADFYEFVAGHIIYLALSDKTGIDFRISYLEKITAKKLDKKIINQVLELTAGHPKLVKVCTEALLASDLVHFRGVFTSDGGRLNASEAMTPPRWTNFLLSQKTVQGALWETWYALLPEEQRFLMDVILIPSLSREKNPMRSFANAQDDIINNNLEKVGLIKKGKIIIPLFAEFIKTAITPQLTKSLHISFNSETNEITKGGQVISDKLTSAEFKILRFFIQNADKIVDREEIINAVWKDAKSTAGVTDQALDQLIFRLRKKIEDNPNKPIHLQTIKGRGFRFTH